MWLQIISNLCLNLTRFLLKSIKILVSRYPQFQTQSKTLTRQKSDTSYDRERPFVTTKKAHQLAKEQIASNQTSPQHVIASSTVYGNVYSSKPETDSGLLGMVDSSDGKYNGPCKLYFLIKIN